MKLSSAQGLFIAMRTLCVCTTGALCLGCATTREEELIPVVKLADTPAPVRATIQYVAAGREIEEIQHLPFEQGHVFRAYIADTSGPQLLTLDAKGSILDNAVVVSFDSMPVAVQEASKTAVAGKLQRCRKSLQNPKTTYVLDYLLGEEEPVFALIEEDGFVRTVVGYAITDPD